MGRLPKSSLVLILAVTLSAAGIQIDSAVCHAQGTLRSPKLHPTLSAVVERIEQAGVTPDTVDLYELGRFTTPLVRVDSRGRVQVYVHVGQVDDATLRALRAEGLTVDHADARSGIVQGWVPFHRVDDIALLGVVKRIRPPDYLMLHGRSGGHPAGDPGITSR